MERGTVAASPKLLDSAQAALLRTTLVEWVRWGLPRGVAGTGLTLTLRQGSSMDA
jgi:hypothetical protein